MYVQRPLSPGGNLPIVRLGLGWGRGATGPAWQEEEQAPRPRQALREEGQSLWSDA